MKRITAMTLVACLLAGCAYDLTMIHQKGAPPVRALVEQCEMDMESGEVTITDQGRSYTAHPYYALCERIFGALFAPPDQLTPCLGWLAPGGLGTQGQFCP